MMFIRILQLEAKRLIRKRNIILILIIIAILALFCADGISEYESIKENQKPFQELENKKVKKHIHYTFYGIRGVRLLLIPNPMSIIFNDSKVFNSLVADIDTAEKLNISNSIKGKELFSDSGGYMDIAGILLMLGSFLGLIYGYDGIRNIQYIRFLLSISEKKNIVFLIILSRIILVCTVCIVILCSTLLILWFEGIFLNLYFLWYTLILFLVLSFFVSIGGFIGSFGKKSIRLIALPTVYFFLIFLVPWLIQKAVYIEAKNTIESIYEYEYRSFKYVMDFEERFYEKFKVWKSGDVAPDDIKAMIQSGQEEEYKKLREYERKRIEKIEKRIRIYQHLSSIFPTSFYLSVNKEISSLGFKNFIRFYRHAYEMKWRFIKFYIDRKFYRKLPKKGVEPFLKENEGIYNSEPGLPSGFWLGIVLTIFQIAIFILLTIKKCKYRLEGKPGALKGLKVNISRGKFNVFLTGDNGLKTQVYNFLFGSGETFIDITVDEKPLENKSFVYIFDISKFPEDITPGALNKFLFGKKLIDDKPIWKILFEFAVSRGEEGRIIVFDEYIESIKKDLEPGGIQKIKEIVAKKSLKILIITNNEFMGAFISDGPMYYHLKDITIETINTISTWNSTS